MRLLSRAKAFVRARVVREERRLLFAFTGGSAAWPGMGRTLYRDHAVFRDSIEACGAVVERMLGWDAASRFRGVNDPETTLELGRRNEVIHLGMLQVAQVDLWRAAGIRPGGVVSVSLGEMVAPYAAEALSRDDCARVLGAVAHAIARTSTDERMIIIGADRPDAMRLARSAPAPLDYLGTMAPGQSVVLCRGRDLEAIRAFLGDAVVRSLESDWNYHTPALDVDRAWLTEQLRDVQSRRPVCPIFSSAAGGALPGGAPFDAQFFAWMVSRPFRYAEAVEAALRAGFDAVLTLGPQPANSPNIAALARAAGKDVRIIDTMRANDEEGAFRTAESALRRLRIVPPRRKGIDAWTLDLGDSDPFAIYEELRRSGPVHYLPRQDYWLFVGYDEVQRALSDSQRFSSAIPELQIVDAVLLGNDGPEHGVLRRLLSRYFAPEAVARRMEVLERTAGRLLQPLAEGRELDAVRDFAYPLTAAMAEDLLGVGPEDGAALDEAMIAAGGDLTAVYAHMQTVVAALAERSTLYTELRRDGLGEEAAQSLVRLLWIAGTTPQHAIAPAIQLLLQYPGVRARVQGHPSLLGAFVEESLRLYPTALLLPRRATVDVSAGGRTIPAGALVQLGLAAANRDPARFRDPAVLRLDRTPNPHLSFGGGMHRCVGAPLGRALIATALRTLFRVAPDFRAVQPLGTIRYVPVTTLREMEQLVIGS